MVIVTKLVFLNPNITNFFIRRNKHENNYKVDHEQRFYLIDICVKSIFIIITGSYDNLFIYLNSNEPVVGRDVYLYCTGSSSK